MIEDSFGRGLPSEVKGQFDSFNQATLEKLGTKTEKIDIKSGDEILNYLINFLEQELQK